ncbi:hypothetical protein [Glycomyces sp. YM15]|uniref:hypothetical protein n=1 Tax=Glycomyces sp. YM15 TaxID=2800446 RepID=UPI0019669C0F|nr:hypothetical protein [Glycomyces sp. YM15]
MTIATGATVIFILCALLAPMQKFVAIWCTLAACSIVTIIFMLCLQLFLSEATAQNAAVHARLDEADMIHSATQSHVNDIGNALAQILTRLPAGTIDDETRRRLDELEAAQSRLRGVLAKTVSDDLALTATEPDALT